MTPTSSVQTLEPWIASRLHPLSEDAAPGGAIRGDGDLGGGWAAAWSVERTPAAVLAALVQRESGLNLILTRRADSLRRHSGQVALPGGRAEPGEAPWTTALREAHEEIGLDPCFVRLSGLGDRYRTGTGFEITPVVGFLEPGFTLTAAVAEVAEIFETPFAFLMDPANHEQRVWRSPEGERRYYAMPHENRLIWGATAGILRSLYERIFGVEPSYGPAQPT